MKKVKRNSQLFVKIGSSSEIRILLIIIAIVIFISIASPYFMTISNITDLLESISVICIMAYGITFVLLVGGIDLSISSNVAASAMVTGFLHLANVPIFYALLGGICTGIVVGLINGAFIEWFGFPDLIVTLAMLSVVRGIVYLAIGNNSLNGYTSSFYIFISRGRLFDFLPLLLIINIIILLIISFILFKTRFGRQIFFAGTNRQAANISGINTKVLRFLTYVICGLLAGVAGVLFGGRLGGVYPQFAEGMELTAIAAAVIGGTSLFGGKGSFVGTFLGSVLVGLIGNVLTLLAINQFWNRIITGCIIIIAVIIDSQISKLVKRITKQRN